MSAFKPAFKRVTRERFGEQLEVLPPIAQCSFGFLMGEPYTHRECRITARWVAAYTALIERRTETGGMEYLESTTPLTVGEWRALDHATLEIVESI